MARRAFDLFRMETILVMQKMIPAVRYTLYSQIDRMYLRPFTVRAGIEIGEQFEIRNKGNNQLSVTCCSDQQCRHDENVKII